MATVKYYIYRNMYDEKSGLMISTTREEEIVFCKDCKFNDGSPHNPLCEKKDYISHSSQDFCSWAERREDV